MSKSRVVSVRLTLNDLAKARDVLISKGMPLEEITSISQIVKLCFFYGIISLTQDPKSLPTDDSINFIKQQQKKTKMASNLTIASLEEK